MKKIIVLGAGVIGTTTAYYLAREGFEVVVVDKGTSVADENVSSSFANAGQISPGYTTPWAAPGIPAKALKWLIQSKHAPLAIRLENRLNFQLHWLFKMWQNCNSKSYEVNKERMMRIANFSLECLQKLRKDIDINYEHRSQGLIQLFRSQEQLDSVKKDIKVLENYGVEYELLNPDELKNYEPALEKAKHKLTGGLRLVKDETGDCQLFTTKLAKISKEFGVKFLFNSEVKKLNLENHKIISAELENKEILEADYFVLAFGSYSRDFLLPLNLSLPIYPLKGYSLTVDLVDENLAPQSTILDETYKIAITRFDKRIRIGGMAEVTGFDFRLSEKRRQTLEMVFQDLFPCGNLKDAKFWTGLRPATYDGTPIIGKCKYSNLFLNSGHGTLGWTMACGSGKLIADLISNKSPKINLDGLSLDRYL